MIRLSNIRKAYGNNLVLRGVNVDIDDGEFISIVGASGSGKSTLLNVIGGLDRDFEGTAKVAGNDIRAMGDREISVFRNTKIGFVFQTFHLLNHLTCGQNVALPAYFNSQMTEQEINRQIDKSLDRVALLHKRAEFPLHLSGGERQRIAIARALFNSPRIILCDEPTGALDTKTGNQIMQLFESLNRDTGVTLIVVTHDVEVSERADRVIRVQDGHIISTGREASKPEAAATAEEAP